MFDESFHSYLEDVDLFIRLNKNGYHYSPLLSASCVHFHMSTSKKMGFYKEYHDFANWIRIIFKNYSISFIIKHFPWLLVERLKNLSGILKKMVKFNDL
jgi:GT2 family glycosyltransferase